MAHFLEHMFFKGTKQRPNARAISEELDSIGSVYNAFTAKDRTAYYAKVSHKHIMIALDVISDLFLNSKLPKKEIDKERGAILQEINMYEDMPMHSVDDVFDATFFEKDTPLSRTILGPKKNIKTFTREMFKTYFTRNYTTHNTVISVAGNFNENKILKEIKTRFKAMSDAPAPICQKARVSSLEEPRVAVKHKKTEQTHLMLGVPAYEYRHKNTYAQMILLSILSGGMSSRLFTEVREKRGLAYSVRAWTQKYTDCAYLAIQAGIEPSNLQEALSVIVSVLKKMKTTKIKPEELKKAKEYILGNRDIQNEKTDHIATSVATEIINTGSVTDSIALKRKLNTVTSDDIKRIANELFNSKKATLAIIGPHSLKEQTELQTIINKM